MNTMSASRSESFPTTPKVLVWDAPVRVFHWLMVLCFAGAWLTAESERQRLVHVTLGYSMVGLVLFRIVWGFVGSRYARFREFVRGPHAVLAYLKGLAGPVPQHFRGHNPAGAVAIVLLLGLSLVVTAAGIATYNELAGDWVEEVHEVAANLMLLVVVVHVLGVIASSFLHRENLVAAMFSGRKPGTPGDAIKRPRRGLALLLLALVLAFWGWQWASTRDLATGVTVAAQATEHAG